MNENSMGDVSQHSQKIAERKVDKGMMSRTSFALYFTLFELPHRQTISQLFFSQIG